MPHLQVSNEYCAYKRDAEQSLVQLQQERDAYKEDLQLALSGVPVSNTNSIGAPNLGKAACSACAVRHPTKQCTAVPSRLLCVQLHNATSMAGSSCSFGSIHQAPWWKSSQQGVSCGLCHQVPCWHKAECSLVLQKGGVSYSNALKQSCPVDWYYRPGWQQRCGDCQEGQAGGQCYPVPEQHRLVPAAEIVPTRHTASKLASLSVLYCST